MKKLLLLLSLSLAIQMPLHAQNYLPGNPVLDSLVTVFTDKVNADSVQAYMQSLEDFGTRFCLADNRREVAEWIQNKFISFGYEDTRLDSFQLSVQYPGWSGNWYHTWQYNVEATYHGYATPDQVYIVGAHHDAIVPSSSNPFLNAPGADDNASGVAGALEIARIMKTYGYVPESTIKFVTFAAEELGLHGAWDYADKAAAENMDIKLMLNNDMISYCTLPESQWKVQIQKYPNSQWATNLAKYIINNFTILGYTETSQSIQYSDSWAFYSNGYPAIFFIEDQFTPYYHTVNDLVSTTNKVYAAEMVKISMGMLIYQNGTGLPTSIEALEAERMAVQLTNYPNPFTNSTAISYKLKEAGQIDISIYNASGRKVESFYSGWQPAGTYSINWDATGLPAGIYLARMETPEGMTFTRLVKY